MGPQFDAIIELYRSGVNHIEFANKSLKVKTLRAGRDIEMVCWPNGAYAIRRYPYREEEIYWGANLSRSHLFRRGANVCGWIGNTPIVRTSRGCEIPTRHGLKPLSKLLAGAEEVVDIGDGALLVVRNYIANGSNYVGDKLYPVVKGAHTWNVKGLEDGAAEFRVWNGGVLAENGTDGVERAPGFGDLWFIESGGKPVRHLAHKKGVDWELIGPAKGGRFLIGARCFIDEWRKFHDYSSIYELSPSGSLKRLVSEPGDWTFYGLDRTNQWVIGTRWQGWEMGAYDLVAVNLKTAAEVGILHSVSKCLLLPDHGIGN